MIIPTGNIISIKAAATNQDVDFKGNLNLDNLINFIKEKQAQKMAKRHPIKTKPKNKVNIN